MLRSKPSTKQGARLGVWCDHRYPLSVVFTELGCHARCLNCGAIGPGKPSSETARQALHVLRVRAGSRHLRMKGRT